MLNIMVDEMKYKWLDQNGDFLSIEDCRAKGSCHHFSRCCVCGPFDWCIHQAVERVSQSD